MCVAEGVSIIHDHPKPAASQRENSVLIATPSQSLRPLCFHTPYAIPCRFPVHNATLAQSIFHWPLIGRHPLAGDAGVFGVDVAVGSPGTVGRSGGLGLAGGGVVE